jgi:hypothetical protein
MMSKLLSRNGRVTAALIAAFAIGVWLLPGTLWIVGLAVLLGLVGAALLSGDRWRSVSILVAAIALGIGLLDLFAGILAPTPVGLNVVHTTDPKEWIPPEPVLGYRLLPDLTVVETATLGSDTIYRVTYHSTAEGTRVTPPAPAGADSYVFSGGSFMFGQGLNDDETLPAQFAHLNDDKVRTVNFSAPGYGVNHLVRMFEVGLFDRYKEGGKVKAVITWIAPSQIEWTTGDGEWLSASPRYVLEDGAPRYTGSFTHHRWINPLAGLEHLAHKYLAFTKQIGERQRQEEQADLFVALLVRAQALARERLGAPLYLVYSWPDDPAPPGTVVTKDSPLPARVLERLRQAGLPLISVNAQTSGYKLEELAIPREGHPTVLTNRLIAAELKRRLVGP